MCRFATRALPKKAPQSDVGAGDDVFTNFPLVDDLSVFNWFDAIEEYGQQPEANTPAKEKTSGLRGLSANQTCLPVKAEEAAGLFGNGDMDFLELFKEDAEFEPVKSTCGPVSAAQPQQAPVFCPPAVNNTFPSSVPFPTPPPAQATAFSGACTEFQAPAQPALMAEQLMSLNTAATAAMLPPVQAQLLQNFATAQWLAMRPNLLKASKAGSDFEESTERIKKKRRESAQRSRARKNAYMKALEIENKALKDENCRLRELLGKPQRQYMEVSSSETGSPLSTPVCASAVLASLEAV